MGESIDREQFRVALADAVSGVLTVYREVDLMFRDLTIALAEPEPRFLPLIRRMVPGAGSKNPDAKYLRNYQASIFAPAHAMDEQDADEDEYDEGAVEGEDGEDSEDDDTDAETRKAKRFFALQSGASLVVARATIYDRARPPSFEPTLMLGVLARCRVEPASPDGALLKTKPGRFKRLFRAIEAHRGGASKPLRTTVTAAIVGASKGKNSKLVFDMPVPMRSYPLFDVSAEKIPAIVATLRADWLAATP